MMKSKQKKPTDAEMAILRVLWKRGPSSVREIFEAMGSDGGYTTVLKFLQIMTAKKLVTRKEEGRSHIYSASEPAEKTQKHLTSDLLERVFGGSAKTLVMQALSVKKASAEDLAEIRKLIEKMERANNS
jgi:predicted transcriptional regulator